MRHDSLSDVVEAAAANTHVWGGLRNPIVAVGDDVTAAIDELRLFRPDLVTVIGEATAAQSAVLGSMRYLDSPALVGEPFEQLNGSMPYADARLICRFHYESTFRSGVIKSRAMMVEWAVGNEIDAYMTVVFGRYRAGPPGDPFRRAFVEGLSAATVGLDELTAAVDVVTPIGLTGTSLIAGGGSSAAGVVIGQLTCPATLLRYWNLRSVGCDVVLWPVNWSGPLADHARAELQKAQRRWSGLRPGSSVSLWMDEEDEPTGARPEAPEELVATFVEAHVPWTVSRSSSALWSWPPAKPRVWATQSRAVLASVETRDNGMTELIAALPPHPFSPAAPARFERPHWLVTISTYRHGDLGRDTFDIPPIPTLTPWASQTLQVIGDVRLEADGIAAFAEVDATSVTLRLVEERAVIQQMFAHAGLTATLSQAGEAADRIVRQMGGLWRCRDLRLHGAALAAGVGLARMDVARGHETPTRRRRLLTLRQRSEGRGPAPLRDRPPCPAGGL